jgi:hypothetical protein
MAPRTAKPKPEIIRDQWNTGEFGRDVVGPDRALRKWSWEDPDSTCRTGATGNARDVHKRLAKVPNLVKKK